MAHVIRQQGIDHYESKSRPGTWYMVVINHDDERHAYLSCNCRAWTTSTRHKGKQAWERNCNHTITAVRDRLTRVMEFLDTCIGRVEWWENGRQTLESAWRVKPFEVKPKKLEQPANPKASRFTQLEV